MKETARSGFLLVAVILMLFGIFCLRHRVSQHRESVASSGSHASHSQSPIRSAPSRVQQLPAGSAAAAHPIPLEAGAASRAELAVQPATFDAPATPQLSRLPPPEVSAPAALQPLPVEPLPVEPLPVEPLPVEPLPVEPLPLQPVSAYPLPAEPRLLEPSSTEPLPADDRRQPAIPAQAPPPQESVVTGPNDSLWRISTLAYGRGDFYKALYLHNRRRLDRPDRVAAGIRIATPSAEELRRLFPEACPEAATHAP